MKKLKDFGELLIGFAGMSIFAYCIWGNLSHYGTRWECGRWYMPRTLFSPNGRTYADGEWIDPYSVALAKSGWEEEVFLVVTVGVIVVLGREIVRAFRTTR